MEAARRPGAPTRLVVLCPSLWTAGGMWCTKNESFFLLVSADAEFLTWFFILPTRYGVLEDK